MTKEPCGAKTPDDSKTAPLPEEADRGITARESILRDAMKCVCGGREHDYGTPENSFETIAKFWTVYLGTSHPSAAIRLTAKDTAMMLALLKVARIAANGNPDSYVDLAGYAACAGEIALNGGDKA